jgi:hypothetical protein
VRKRFEPVEQAHYAGLAALLDKGRRHLDDCAGRQYDLGSCGDEKIAEPVNQPDGPAFEADQIT